MTTGRSRGAKLRITRGSIADQIKTAREDANALVEDLKAQSPDEAALTAAIHRAEQIAATLRVVRARVKAAARQDS